MGDFNSVLGAHEHRSPNLPLAVACQEFRDFVDDCDLVEVQTLGSKFTWTNALHV